MNWKRLLLIGLVAGGLAFVPAQRSNAGVSVGIGFGFPGYYPGYYYPYPYYYYRPYPYYGYYYGPSFYWYGGASILLPPPSSFPPSVISRGGAQIGWLENSLEPAFLYPYASRGAQRCENLRTACYFGDPAGFAAGC